MSKTVHTIYVTVMVVIIIMATLYLIWTGYDYYQTALEERFYHAKHDWFKPSGIYGHGIGILGTFMILFGVVLYIARKRYNFMAKYIRLKYLLEFHIFLCTLGPILILFHTAFKFGGIVSVAFWSMVAVVASGVIGRFIYIQIPRTIEGRALTLAEVKGMKTDIATVLKERYKLDDDTISTIVSFSSDESDSKKKMTTGKIRKLIKSQSLPRDERSVVMKMIKEEKSLSGRIKRLEKMQQLFKY